MSYICCSLLLLLLGWVGLVPGWARKWDKWVEQHDLEKVAKDYVKRSFLGVILDSAGGKPVLADGAAAAVGEGVDGGAAVVDTSSSVSSSLSFHIN